MKRVKDWRDESTVSAAGSPPADKVTYHEDNRTIENSYAAKRYTPALAGVAQ